MPFLIDGNVDDFTWLSYPAPDLTALASNSLGNMLAAWVLEYAGCQEVPARQVTSDGAPVFTAPDASHGEPWAEPPSDLPPFGRVPAPPEWSDAAAQVQASFGSSIFCVTPEFRL